jgi:hypothetical protein
MDRQARPLASRGVAGTRVAILGEPELVAACTPSGPGIEVVPADAGDPPELVLVLGGAVPEDLPAPAVVWVLEGDGPPPGLHSGDRVVSPRPGVRDAWRTLPLPVADELFSSAVGEERRDGVWRAPGGPELTGLPGSFWMTFEFADAPDDAAIVLILREGEAAAFEPAAARALAAGRLLVSAPLEPPFGLEPGIDYLEIRDRTEMFMTVENAVRAPDAFTPVRIRGRRKAEWFRASRMVERLAQDLRLESASERAGAPG